MHMFYLQSGDITVRPKFIKSLKIYITVMKKAFLGLQVGLSFHPFFFFIIQKLFMKTKEGLVSIYYLLNITY